MINVREVGPADVAIPVECSVHQGQTMTAYCMTCKVLICSTCQSTLHADETHVRESVEVASARVHAELTPLLVARGVHDPLVPLLDVAILQIEETRTALWDHHAEQHDSITAQEVAGMTRLKEDADAKRAEITAAVERTNAALLDQQAALRQHEILLRQMNDYIHALLAMVKGSELVQVGSAIKERIEVERNLLEAEALEPVVVQERFPHFVSAATQLTLGQIVKNPITRWKTSRQGTPKAIYVLGGFSGLSIPTTPRSNLQYHARRQSWKVQQVDKLRVMRFGHAAARIDSHVFVLGGSTFYPTDPEDDETRFAKTMERLNMTKSDAVWTRCAPMFLPRTFVAAVSIKGFLFALGGKVPQQQGPDFFTSTVERYDPVLDAWTECAPMPNAVSNHAAVALNDHIYVLGGFCAVPAANDDEEIITAGVNRWDPATGTWTACAPMRTARCNFAAAVINGSIIVAGGLDDDDAGIATVERYDAAANTWTECAPMPTARGYTAGCAVGMSFYVVGGLLDITGGLERHLHVSLTTVERYDVDTNSWERCPSMPELVCMGTALAW